MVAAENAADEFWTRTFPPPWRIEEQGDGDLGIRLETAFRREFASYERVAAVGSDHPDLSRDELVKLLLSPNGLWPTRDGGYAAILLTRSSAALELFRGIEWSTSTVFARTVERARERRIEFAVAPETGDVDVEDDLDALYDRLSRRNPGLPDFPAHTWREISRLEPRAARR